jgi:hypothetical protein
MVAHGQNPSEGGASGGRRRWSGHEERWGKVWRSREGGEQWVMEERTGVRACFERPVGGAAEREKGGRGGVWPRECYAVQGVSWGLAPTDGQRPAAARVRRARAGLRREKRWGEPDEQ